MRYTVGKPRAGIGWVEAEGDYDEPARNEITVDGKDAVDTGLVTVAGEPIMRLPIPIGFGRDEEW